MIIYAFDNVDQSNFRSKGFKILVFRMMKPETYVFFRKFAWGIVGIGRDGGWWENTAGGKFSWMKKKEKHVNMRISFLCEFSFIYIEKIYVTKKLWNSCFFVLRISLYLIWVFLHTYFINQLFWDNTIYIKDDKWEKFHWTVCVVIQSWKSSLFIKFYWPCNAGIEFGIICAY